MAQGPQHHSNTLLGEILKTVTSIVTKKRHWKASTHILINTHTRAIFCRHAYFIHEQQCPYQYNNSLFQVFSLQWCLFQSHTTDSLYPKFTGSIPSILASPVAWLTQLGIKDPLNTNDNVAFQQLPVKGSRYHAVHVLYCCSVCQRKDERNILIGESFWSGSWGKRNSSDDSLWHVDFDFDF